jgi:hypothetical protein
MATMVIEGLTDHRGEWVAVDYANRRVVLSSPNRAALIYELKRLGLAGAVVVHVPNGDEPLRIGLG